MRQDSLTVAARSLWHASGQAGSLSAAEMLPRVVFAEGLRRSGVWRGVEQHPWPPSCLTGSSRQSEVSPDIASCLVGRQPPQVRTAGATSVLGQCPLHDATAALGRTWHGDEAPPMAPCHGECSRGGASWTIVSPVCSCVGCASVCGSSCSTGVAASRM